MGLFLGLFTTSLSVGGCGKIVAQDAKTGKDGKPKGAKPIKMDDEGEGTAKDIVSYPGGDRVDWKHFTLKKLSDVEVELKWNAPRPGLDLSFNILDENFRVIKKIKPSAAEGRRTRKSAELEGLTPGKYYVQIYASGRADAGEYTVDVHAKEQKVARLVPFPDPPKLPMVPEAAGADGKPALPPGKCPKDVPEAKCNQMLALKCPFNAPAGTPCSCELGKYNPPPCPPPPSCGPEATAQTDCVCEPKKTPPPCPVTAQPKRANIIQKTLQGQEVLLVLDKGSAAGIVKGWTGHVLVGNTQNMLAGSTFVVYQVSDDEAFAKVRKISLDEIGQNFKVLLIPPAAP